MPDFDELRAQMVERQLLDRGITKDAVLKAMGTVRREQFVALHLRDSAYEDGPLAIGAGQTISQPFIVAYMIEALALETGDTVLEIGAGSGYAAAVLSQIVQKVYAVERIAALAAQAKRNLETAECQNVHVIHGDGTEGCEEAGPFDGVLVSAGAPEVPASLMQQLRVGGRMVIPVGPDQSEQVLLCVTRRSSDAFDQEKLTEVRFVPLIGREGWPREDPPWYFNLEQLITGSIV